MGKGTMPQHNSIGTPGGARICRAARAILARLQVLPYGRIGSFQLQVHAPSSTHAVVVRKPAGRPAQAMNKTRDKSDSLSGR